MWNRFLNCRAMDPNYRVSLWRSYRFARNHPATNIHADRCWNNRLMGRDDATNSGTFSQMNVGHHRQMF